MASSNSGRELILAGGMDNIPTTKELVFISAVC